MTEKTNKNKSEKKSSGKADKPLTAPIADNPNALDAYKTLPELSYANKDFYDKALEKFGDGDPAYPKGKFMYDAMKDWSGMPKKQWEKQYQNVLRAWTDINHTIPAKEAARDEARQKAIDESRQRAKEQKAAQKEADQQARAEQIEAETKLRVQFTEMLRKQIQEQDKREKALETDKEIQVYYEEALSCIDSFDPHAAIGGATAYPIEIQGTPDTITSGLYSITGLSVKGKTVAYQHRIDFRQAVATYAEKHSDLYKGTPIAGIHYPKLLVVSEPVKGALRTPNNKSSWLGFCRVLEHYLQTHGVVIVNSATFLLGFNPIGTSDNSGTGPSKEGLYKQFEAVLSELDQIAERNDAILVCVWNLSSTPGAVSYIEGKSRGVFSLGDGFAATWSRRQYVVVEDSFVGPAISEQGRKPRAFAPISLPEEAPIGDDNVTAHADELGEEW